MAATALAPGTATTTLPTPPSGTPVSASGPGSAQTDIFARYTRDYAADRFGQPIAILQAGCTTAAHDLGADELRAGGTDLIVTLVDDDDSATQAAIAARADLAGATLGDLRSVPLPPRSADIVQCCLLLDRIQHAELVLDRVVAAIKPGGLLLLQIRDRDSAAGLFDRIAPAALRRLVWRARHPGRPGPYPAVYERLSSARGVQQYVLLRGLALAERRAVGGLSGGLPRGPHGYLLAQRLIARLSRGRVTAAHEDLLYVLRKRENPFARIL